MHQTKEMLKKMGYIIVADEVNRVGGEEDGGFFVVEKCGTYHRVDYYFSSYGGEPEIISVRKVEPKEVTKVEYV